MVAFSLESRWWAWKFPEDFGRPGCPVRLRSLVVREIRSLRPLALPPSPRQPDEWSNVNVEG